MPFILEGFAVFKSMGVEKKMQKQCTTTTFQWASNSFQGQVSQIPYGKRLPLVAAGVTQCHPLQSAYGGLCVSRSAGKAMGQSEPRAERQDEGSGLRGKAKRGRAIWAVVARKVWSLPAPSVRLHLLLLTASPRIFCRKSDSNMLTAGPQGRRNM